MFNPLFHIRHCVFPDPVAVLEQALAAQKKAEKVTDLEIENKQLRDTLDEYNSEFAEVKHQGIKLHNRDHCENFVSMIAIGLGMTQTSVEQIRIFCYG